MSEMKTKTITATTIVPDRPICTMINTLTVKPGKQGELLAYLKKMTEEDVVTCPGFISANFHISEDGTRVINYAQWRGIEDLQAMLARFPEHVSRCQELTENIEIRTDLKVVYCAYASTSTQQ
jgi:antibiotic biosynthesis monooxygenase (ABM) superfamily enzyme